MATCVRQMVIITILLITSLFFLRYFLTDSTSEELLSGNFLPSTDNQQKLHVSLFLSRDWFEEELSGEISVVGVVPSEPESGVEISACDDKEEPSSDTRWGWPLTSLVIRRMLRWNIMRAVVNIFTQLNVPYFISGWIKIVKRSELYQSGQTVPCSTCTGTAVSVPGTSTSSSTSTGGLPTTRRSFRRLSTVRD